MALRKFKSSWIPTSLRVDPALLAAEDEAESAPAPAPDSVPGAVLASAAGTALAAAAASARATVTHSALGLAASSALASARSTVANSALASVAGSALATARASTAASLLAAALEPIPSPVALVNRASFIFKFFLVSFARESFNSVLSLFGIKRERTVKAAYQAREFAERLGGSWIIFMRLTALRGDLLGEKFCRELARTRDLSAPLPAAVIRKIVDEDLQGRGSSFDETFSEFDEHPLVVRSFGQGHRARLRESGEEVVLRVRAPDAVQRAKTDWRYLRIMLFFLEQLDIEPHMRWGDLFFEVKKSTDDILDFRTEVQEIKRLRKILRKRRVYVPLIYPRLCTERILVVEHVSGVDVEDLIRLSHHDPERCDDWMRENGIDHRRVWRRLFNAHNQLIFENNLFYTDLAPGSIILLKDNRLALVSFGTIGTLDADLQSKYRQLFRALLDKDYSKVCDTYLMMGPPLPYKDISNMKQTAIRSLRKWEARTHIKQCPFHEKSLGSAIGQLARCAKEQKLPAFWNLARLQIAENTLTKSLEFFNPTKSSMKAFEQYERSAELRSIKDATTKKVRKRVDAAIDVAQLNMQLLENVQHDGDYLRRRLMSVQSKLSKTSEIVGRLVKVIGKLAMAGLLLQLFLHFSRGGKLPDALPGSFGRFLSAIIPRSTTAWVVTILLLFYFRRFLVNLTRQLFMKEVRPGDVT